MNATESKYNWKKTALITAVVALGAAALCVAAATEDKMRSEPQAAGWLLCQFHNSVAYCAAQFIDDLARFSEAVSHLCPDLDQYTGKYAEQIFFAATQDADAEQSCLWRTGLNFFGTQLGVREITERALQGYWDRNFPSGK